MLGLGVIEHKFSLMQIFHGEFMEQIQIKAHAKINLAIDVLSRRPDGYHNLRMVMQSLAFHDTLVITKSPECAVTLACDSPRVPSDKSNLAHRAAEKMIETYSLRTGVHIEIRKIIPVAAGLAGGSSNAAAVLNGMNALFRLGLAKDELAAVGKGIGADVPYCVFGGTMLAEGVGDILAPLSPHPRVSVVLAKPPIEVSTAQVFRDFSQTRVAPDIRPDISSIMSGLDLSDIREISRGISTGMANVLESVTAAAYPVIDDIKASLLRHGAECAIMSGSGPTVFAYFIDEEYAVAAARSVRREIPSIDEIFVTSI